MRSCLYLNLRFQTPMKCSNRVGEVPEHGPELHVLLPWVAVTMHRVSWLPARIVCLDISLTMFKVSLQVHIINITLERIAKKKSSDLEMETAGCSTSTAEDLVAKNRGWGSCLLGSHHWTLSPRLLYSRSEWKLLLPACQERRRLHPGLGNTHSHKLQPFFGKN